jgi:hypothetical protein
MKVASWRLAVPWAAPYTGMNADSACVQYTGCLASAPVVWCPIGGGHGNLGSADGIWPFWASLP